MLFAAFSALPGLHGGCISVHGIMCGIRARQCGVGDFAADTLEKMWEKKNTTKKAKISDDNMQPMKNTRFMKHCNTRVNPK